MRFDAPWLGSLGVLGGLVAIAAPRSGTTSAAEGRARTPGTVGHAKNSIKGSGVACSETSTATGYLSRTAHTATGGLLARGAAANIAASHARLQEAGLFPGPYRVIVPPGILEEFAPVRIVPGPLDP